MGNIISIYDPESVQKDFFSPLPFRSSEKDNRAMQQPKNAALSTTTSFPSITTDIHNPINTSFSAAFTTNATSNLLEKPQSISSNDIITLTQYGLTSQKYGSGGISCTGTRPTPAASLRKLANAYEMKLIEFGRNPEKKQNKLQMGIELFEV
jgi:hypothetical protein